MYVLRVAFSILSGSLLRVNHLVYRLIHKTIRPQGNLNAASNQNINLLQCFLSLLSFLQQSETVSVYTAIIKKKKKNKQMNYFISRLVQKCSLSNPRRALVNGHFLGI
jgi:hypothetical protein